MAADSFYPQTYTNSKGQISKHYVWKSNLETAVFKCPHTEETLTFENIYKEPTFSAPGIRPLGEKGRF